MEMFCSFLRLNLNKLWYFSVEKWHKMQVDVSAFSTHFSIYGVTALSYINNVNEPFLFEIILKKWHDKNNSWNWPISL